MNDGPPELRPPRFVLRGDPAEAASWSALAPFGLQWLADGRSPPTRRTEVRVGASETELALRFDCHDAGARATLTERDAPLYSGDVVELFLAPGSDDPTRYFEFEVNPLGALFDAVVENPDAKRETMRVNTTWDCPGLRWGARTDRGAAHWCAWLVIPWSTVAPPEARPPVWRANFHRIERSLDGSAEFICWSPTLIEPADFHKPQRFGRLVTSLNPMDEAVAPPSKKPRSRNPGVPEPAQG